MADDLDMTQEPHILVRGNVVDGFAFTGPFTDAEAAIQAGEDLGGEWCIAPLAAYDDAVHTEPEDDALDVSAVVEEGDPTSDGRARYYAQTTVGSVTVTAYESLDHPGHVIVDVDNEPDNTALAITVNDEYVYSYTRPE